jgi:predicted membrane GTPase involved in stress response
MIVGEHTRGNDLEINVLKGKQLTNIRAAGRDEAVRLTPPVRMTLEKALAYIEDDELVEVTPKSIRCARRCSIPMTASARSAPRKARNLSPDPSLTHDSREVRGIQNRGLAFFWRLYFA